MVGRQLNKLLALTITRVDGAELGRRIFSIIGSTKLKALKGRRKDGNGRRQIGGKAIVSGNQRLIDEPEGRGGDAGTADDGDAGDGVGWVARGQLEGPAGLMARGGGARDEHGDGEGVGEGFEEDLRHEAR